nr:thiamine pyrophosphate-binding protein [Pseudactinotalea sp. HY158]
MNRGNTRPREGGDALIAALARHGITSLFSVSGGPINSAYYATTRHDMRIVHVRHEAAGGFMADSVYRSTGVPGAVLATLGPGVANTVTPAACAMSAGVPMLIIGGQAGTRVLHRGAGMEMDTMSIMRPVTKWAAQVLHADRIPEFVDEAYRRMMAGTPGPVYLEIPTDVLSSQLDDDTPPSPWTDPAPAAPDERVMTQVRGLIEHAKRPVLIAGDGVFHSGAHEGLREFVARAEIPVATLRLGRGAIDERHDPWWFGPAYIPCNPVLSDSLEEADLVVLLGHHWEFDLEFGSGLGAATTVVQVHRDPAALGRNGRADVAVNADSGPFIAALAELTAGDRDGEWTRGRATAWQQEQARLTTQTRQAPEGEERPHPLAVIDAVIAAAPADARFITSHGNVDFWADPRIPVSAPQTYLRSGQSGALGAELPYAVGSALENPDSPSILFVGDGAVGYHLVEIETAARFGAPVIVVVLDDNSWGAIAMPQRMSYDVEVALELPPRDWAAVATGLGARGYDATVDTVGAILQQAVASGGPAIVHVPIRPTLSPYMAHIS